MEINYHVHSLDADAPIEVEAVLKDGTETKATVPGYVLELTEDDSDTSHTFRVRGECDFAVGDAIKGVFTKA